MNKPAILVFAYHDVGYECLDALIQNDENITAVITHEDDPGEEVWFRSVRELAGQYDIPVYSPGTVNNDEWIDRIRSWEPDLIFSFYYRNMLSEEVLSVARLGAFNMHGSLLPRYRGRAPINWAILNGEQETGATLHHMVRRADAGDIVDQETVPIGPDDTARDVFDKVTAAARRVLERQIEAITSGTAPRRQQDESQATYFGGRTPADGRIDWSWSARRIYDLVRAVTHPYPGAFTTIEGAKLFIWDARPLPGSGGRPGEVLSENPLQIATGDGALEVRLLQWDRKDEEDASTGRHGLKAGEFFDGK